MARNRSDNTEPLIPIDMIAAKLGLLYEVVAGRIKPADITHDWDGSLCVRWSQAKTLFETLSEERAVAAREQAARMEAQLADELAGRMRPYTAWLESQGKGVTGLQVTTPPASETEEWAQ